MTPTSVVRSIAATWVRWRSNGRWSSWHRVLTTSESLVETSLLTAEGGQLLEQTHITSCGIVVYPDLVTQQSRWPDPAQERCVACLRTFLVVLSGPPSGWPGGGPSSRGRRRIVLRADRGRRPLNQPSL